MTIRILLASDWEKFDQTFALMVEYHLLSEDIVICLGDDGQTPANEVDKLLKNKEEWDDFVCVGNDRGIYRPNIY